eukprot:TRINITY_DN4745_c0_g1_i1.p1 TRINITY_DN4745_c0_g1~~TRINITY_DN4745_c0_g1_i1.p1  ORF type:complete len:116 (-),score=22.10 TRINITY_DN4745_c0_g1_i1:15-362(-)
MNTSPLTNLLTLAHTQDDVTLIRTTVDFYFGPDLLISSWKHIGMHTADFGGGRPYFVGLLPNTKPGWCLLLNTEREDGTVDMWLTLTEEQAEVFEGLRLVDHVQEITNARVPESH